MFSWWIIIWLLSLPDLSIQKLENKVLCDTTIKETESKEFNPCLKFKHQYEDCSNVKIERGFARNSQMGLRKCYGRDDNWIECACKQHARCIILAKRKLRDYSQANVTVKCEPEIIKELNKKREEWRGETSSTFATTKEIIIPKRRTTGAASTNEPEVNNTAESVTTISEAIFTTIEATTEVMSTEIAAPESTIPPVKKTTAVLTAGVTGEITTKPSKTIPTTAMTSSEEASEPSSTNILEPVGSENKESRTSLSQTDVSSTMEIPLVLTTPEETFPANESSLIHDPQQEQQEHQPNKREVHRKAALRLLLLSAGMVCLLIFQLLFISLLRRAYRKHYESTLRSSSGHSKGQSVPKEKKQQGSTDMVTGATQGTIGGTSSQQGNDMVTGPTQLTTGGPSFQPIRTSPP
ncbi:hypothetical protein V3C99_010931 [Haemonchus contortus]